ncbi:MAG: T9SS type A sorting domain-containing protein, partial [bacterium]
GTTSADLHYRVAVCDSPTTYTGRAPGWLYAHIDRNRPHRALGDRVEIGDTIGFLVYWTVTGFDHLHFARISDTGSTWMRFPNVTWWFIQNPMTIMEPMDDRLAPVFEDARTGARFAFCRDNTRNNYLAPTALAGDVDIIARIYDKTGYTTGNATWDKLTPFQIDYSIKSAGGSVVLPWTISFKFSNSTWYRDTLVIYKNDNTCRSYGDYDRRQYCFIVSNTDGDTVIEPEDTQGKWATASVGDGNYWVFVRASDIVGNTTVDSMLVTTANGTAVAADRPAWLTRRLQATPNPARGRTRLAFGLGAPARAELRVIDALGRVAAKPVSGTVAAGDHAVTLSGLPAGVYSVELRVGAERYTERLVITR